jgi:hypothetical protein
MVNPYQAPITAPYRSIGDEPHRSSLPTLVGVAITGPAKPPPPATLGGAVFGPSSGPRSAEA